MSSVVKIPARFAFVVVEDLKYTPDANGLVKVDEAHHVEALKWMGGKVVNERVAAPVVESVTEKPSPEEPTQPLSEATEHPSEAKVYPNDNWKRAEVLSWLKENQIAVDPNITKVAALKIVAGIKAAD